MVIVQYGDERARVYLEGGIGFDHFIRGVGWVVNDQPGSLIFKLALAIRKIAFPTLTPID